MHEGQLPEKSAAGNNNSNRGSGRDLINKAVHAVEARLGNNKLNLNRGCGTIKKARLHFVPVATVRNKKQTAA